MLDRETASRFLDADCGSKKKRKKRKKQRTKKGRVKRSRRSCSESKQYLLPYLLGAAHKENEMLKAMIKLSLAASKGTLREDVLEIGCEVLGDGKD